MTTRRADQMVLRSQTAGTDVLTREPWKSFLRGVTPLTARQAGLFRIMLATWMALLHFVFYRDGSVYLHGPYFEGIATGLDWAAALTYPLFAIGAATIVVHPLAVIIFVLHALTATHASIPFVAGMLMTLAVPLGDGLSLDRYLLGDAVDSRSQPSVLYGCAPWGFGLILSFAYGSAGISKLSVSGPEWLRYGLVGALVEDSFLAPSDLGVFILNHPSLTALISTGAVLTELTWFVVPFLRSYRARTALGLTLSVGLVIGFATLMGVLWVPFIASLHLFFFPWHRMLVHKGSQAPRSQSSHQRRERLFAAGVTGVTFVQALAVVFHLEVSPFFSDYPMYNYLLRPAQAETFLSEYKERGRGVRLSVVAVHSDGSETDMTSRVDLLDSLLLGRKVRYDLARLYSLSLRGQWDPALASSLSRELMGKDSDVLQVSIRAHQELMYDTQTERFGFVKSSGSFVLEP